MFDLAGRVVLVTGAGQGVGAGIARAFAAAGARVAVNDLYAERARKTAHDIEAAGGVARAAPFDVGDYEAVRAGIGKLEADLGPLDVLVNNAGIPEGMGIAPFLETLPESWRPYVDVNLYGVMNCAHVAVKGMCARGRGRVITISSGAGTVGVALGVSPYGAGKGGGISFMRHLAMETARHGVTANTIALGLIDNHADPSITEAMARSIPVGRLGTPEDVAPLCVYLASDEAAWMTGQTLELNGGSTTT